MNHKKYIKLSLAIEELVIEYGATICYEKILNRLYINNNWYIDPVEVDGLLHLERKDFDKLITYYKEG